MDSIMSIFSPKVPDVGPDAATLRAQADQNRRLQEADALAAREGGARQRLISATQQRGGPITLFRRTGARGVTEALGGA